VGTGVSAIAVAASDPSVVYVGFDDGTLEVSKDAGSTFTALSPGVADWITHIAVDPANPGRIALSFSDSNTHAYSVPPMVQLGTVSLGGRPSGSFSDVTGDLPSGVASNSVLFDGASLVVATDVGVFATDAATPSGWSAVASGLPNVQVIGLTLDGAGNLYAATHGRGIWELPGPPPPPPPPPPGAPPPPGTPPPPPHTSHTPPPPSAAAIRTALSHLIRSAPRRATLLRQGATLTFSAPSAGRLQITWTVASGRRHVVIATLQARLTGARRVRLHLALTAAGRRLLRGRRRIVIVARSVFAPTDGRTQSVSRTIFSK
jgi:hypothetical protein